MRSSAEPLDPVAIAIAALSHFATDPRTLSRFFALTGLDPQSLREAAASPSTVLRAGLHLGRLTQPLALLAALQHEAARACAAPIEEMRFTLLGAEAADHTAGPAERPERALARMIGPPSKRCLR